MSIVLHTRTVRIGTSDRHRDIVVREVLEAEIQSLKNERWTFAGYGVLAGMLIAAGTAFLLYYQMLGHR